MPQAWLAHRLIEQGNQPWPVSIMKIRWRDALARFRCLALRPRKPGDRIHLTLNGLSIGLERRLCRCLPHEVTIVVPRAEIKVVEENGRREVTVTMNSITVAHAPRFPPRGR